MLQVIMQIIALLVSVGTIVYAVPFFIVPAIVIAYIHLWFARGYINCSRDLRRIESNTRSPIISSFGELVVGIVTGTSILSTLTTRYLTASLSARIWLRKELLEQHVQASGPHSGRYALLLDVQSLALIPLRLAWGSLGVDCYCWVLDRRC